MYFLVHIANGDIIKSIRVNAGTPTDEVYEDAKDMAMLEKCHHIRLRRRNHGQRVLENGANTIGLHW